MDGNSKHKADALGDGWVLDSEHTREEESEIVSEWGKHCSVNCQNVSILTSLFPPFTSVTSHSDITWYEKP